MNLLLLVAFFVVVPVLIAFVVHALGTIFADELHTLRSLFSWRNPFRPRAPRPAFCFSAFAYFAYFVVSRSFCLFVLNCWKSFWLFLVVLILALSAFFRGK